ncbi:hypothetical protein R80B4_00494 [Fibrobacteres bacterium R8-0-B4]
MSAYVRQSAKLKCSMGSAQSTLQVSHPTAPVLLCGSPMAAMADSKSMANLAPFGLCKSLANPAVAAATAAASGKLQKMPCIPCVTSPWAVAKADVSVKGLPALTNESRCVCMWLGMIKIKNPGQKCVSDTAPPPFITEDPPSPAAAPQAKEGDPKAAGAPTPQGGAAQTPKKGLLAAATNYVKALIKNAVNTAKNRAASIASAIATAVQGYVTAILTTAGAAAMAVVGGIFGIRGKNDDSAEKDATKEQAMEEETPNAATETNTTITAKLTRYYFNDKRTIGTFQVFRGNELLFKCYSCEDTVRGDGNPDTVKRWKIAKESAIPYGKYICTRRLRTHKKKIGDEWVVTKTEYAWLVTDVPGYSGIWIHHGNTEIDTEGCLLLGTSVAPNYSMISRSDLAIANFEKHIADYGNQDFELEITKDTNGEVAKSEGLKSKESNSAATTSALTANGKSADGTQKTSVTGVTGPQDASVGQTVEYQAIFNINNVSDADRKKVTWAVSFPGIWPVNDYKLTEQGDKLILEIKQKWHREDILVYARMRAFEQQVNQRTSIDPDLKTANANRAKVCASCKFQSEMKGGCRFKESKYGYIIGDVEFNDAAKKLGVEVELMKAIGEKESRGLGFRRVGQATILFERHRMREHLVATKKYSPAKIDELMEKYPGIVNTKSGNYTPSSYDKLQTAKTIDVDCAIMSCSWGRFQVMGENFLWGKYSSPQELELAMNACDLQQFKYFVAFLEKKHGMLNALLSKNWEKIAECYNGKEWKTKNPTYAGDIEKYYYQFKNNPTKT